MKNHSKGGLKALLFLLLSAVPMMGYSLDPLAELAKSPQWKALFHAKDITPLIKDPGFFISDQRDDLHRELVRTLKRLNELPSNSNLLCRYPARYSWLHSKLKYSDLNLTHCSDLNHFLQKAPHERISIIYSSENLTSPSSMMGHILLKVSGSDSNGLPRSHAISFFTEMNSLNVPKIVIDSLIFGKEGIFSLSPYQDKLDFYLKKEGRNIWEYELNLSEKEKLRLMHHIWELKTTKIDYFFNSYNCATLTNFLVAVAKPSILMSTSKRVTPLDIVKNINALGLVRSKEVTLASKWHIRMLTSALKKESMDSTIQFLRSGNLNVIKNISNEKERTLSIDLARHALSLPRSTQGISPQRRIELNLMVRKLQNNVLKSFSLDLSEYKNPIKTPQDSQWSIGVAFEDGNKYSRLSYMPASHDIEDDNRQYFSENELKMASLSILAGENKIILDDLSIYSVQSFLPHHPLIGGLSGRMNLGLVRHFDSSMEKHSSFDFSGGLGKSISPIEPILFYGLMSGGFGFGKNRGYAYASPEVGLFIRERNDFKSHLHLKYTWNEFNTSQGVSEFSFTQSKYISKNWATFIKFKRTWANRRNSKAFELIVKRYL